MNLQEAIESVRVLGKFPEEAFDVISRHKEEALPIMREAVRNTAANPASVSEEDMLHFYAPLFLAEFRDTASFPDLIKLVTLPPDDLNTLYNDAITEGLPGALYCTFNGDTELLKRAGRDPAVDEFMRAGILDVLAKLCQDGILNGPEFKEYLREYANHVGDEGFIPSKLADCICWCHLRDLLQEVWEPDNDSATPGSVRTYSNYIDTMYNYDEKIPLESSIKVSEFLRNWAMFNEEGSSGSLTEAFGKALDSFMNQRQTSSGNGPAKIGRNDPCPCGSGKKYKHCCLNKPANPLDSIQNAAERSKALKRYPYLGKERIPGRIYLADFYDEEAIEIDRLLYLAFMQPTPLFSNNREADEKRNNAYLMMAYKKFTEKVSKENIHSFTEYDRKFGIHFFSLEWISILQRKAGPDLKMQLRKMCAMMGGK